MSIKKRMSVTLVSLALSMSVIVLVLCPSPLYTQGNTRTVLWDVTHGWYVSGINTWYPKTDRDNGRISAWEPLMQHLENLGYQHSVTQAGVDSLDLSQYDMIVIATTQTMSSAYSQNEVDAIDEFLENGGGLLIAGENTWFPNEYVNPVTALAGVTFDGDEQCGDDYTVFSNHRIFNNVSMLRHSSGASLSIQDPGVVACSCSPSEVMATSQNPKIVVVGDTCVLTTHFNEPGGHESWGNGVFAENVFDWLSTSVFLYLSTDGDPSTDQLHDFVPEGYDPIQQTNPTVQLIAKLNHLPEYAQTATFELSETTNYLGYAMNKGTSLQPDYKIPAGSGSVPFLGVTAETDMIVTDYGGSTKATVHVMPADVMAEIDIPIDNNSNGIADAKWIATDGLDEFEVSDCAPHESSPCDPTGSLDLDGCADDESSPLGRGAPFGGYYDGDGLSAWEEYRGFMVRDTHRRTNPEKKDLFVAVDGILTFGFIDTLETWDHRLFHSGETDPVTNVVNFNRPPTCPSDSSVDLQDQRAVIANLVECWDGNPLIGPPVGRTCHITDPNCDEEDPNIIFAENYSPNNVDHVDVCIDGMAVATPPNYGFSTPNGQPCDSLTIIDDYDATGYDKTLTHEVGHAVSLCHYTFPDDQSSQCPSNCGPAQYGDCQNDNRNDCVPEEEDCADKSVSCKPSSVMVSGTPCWGYPDPQVQGSIVVDSFGRPCALGQALNEGAFWLNYPTSFDLWDQDHIRVH